MPEKQHTCFEPSHLSRFLHEELSELEETTVIEHLDGCPDCQATLERVAASGDRVVSFAKPLWREHAARDWG